MEGLKPLIDAAAHWIEADIAIRVTWNVVGSMAAVAGIAIATFLGVALSDRIRRPSD